MNIENKPIRELLCGIKRKIPEDSKVTDPKSYFMDEIEVRKFKEETKPINHKRWWKKEDILKLYQGLFEVGYSLDLLEIYFNHKWTKKQIQSKIKREEKIRPELIKKAIEGKLQK